jgi:hypothetical protein
MLSTDALRETAPLLAHLGSTHGLTSAESAQSKVSLTRFAVIPITE